MENKDGFQNLVPMVLAIVITFALLFVGIYINGTIHEELDDSSTASRAKNAMNNTSDNFDNTLDIVQVVIIITVLATAIGAIFMFTRFR
jgi:flagellar biosynthesis protein FliP